MPKKKAEIEYLPWPSLATLKRITLLSVAIPDPFSLNRPAPRARNPGMDYADPEFYLPVWLPSVSNRNIQQFQGETNRGYLDSTKMPTFSTACRM